MQAEHERRMKDIEVQLRGAETATVERISQQFSAPSSGMKFPCCSPRHRVVSPAKPELSSYIIACLQSNVKILYEIQTFHIAPTTSRPRFHNSDSCTTNCCCGGSLTCNQRNFTELSIDACTAIEESPRTPRMSRILSNSRPLSPINQPVND